MGKFRHTLVSSGHRPKYDYRNMLNLQILLARNSILQKLDIFVSASEEWPENLGNMAENREIYCCGNKQVFNFNREYWHQNLQTVLVFLHVRSDYLLRLQNFAFALWPFTP